MDVIRKKILIRAPAGNFLHLVGKFRHSQERFCILEEKLITDREVFASRRKYFWMPLGSKTKARSLIFENLAWQKFNILNFKIFIPWRDCESSTVGGPIVFYLCIISVRKRIWHFQNPHIPSAFLKSSECFIPWRDSAEQSPKVVQLFLL